MNETTITCPYCGEAFVALIDWSAGEQAYVEDCEICCRPIEFRLYIAADGEPDRVDVTRDDD